MKTSKEQLADLLNKKGWLIKHVFTDDLEWWADEIWELSSRWSPEGVAAFITYLVDPQHEGRRLKGQAVWGVGSCANFSKTLAEAQSNDTISLRSILKGEVNEFLQKTEHLRSGTMHSMGL